MQSRLLATRLLVWLACRPDRLDPILAADLAALRRARDGGGASPLVHRDPFDRRLLVQARTEQLNRLTADRMLTGSGENGLWVGG